MYANFVLINTNNVHTKQNWQMKEDLLEGPRIQAIQEQLCGFLLDEVINPNGEFWCDPRVSIGQLDPRANEEEEDDLPPPKET